MARKQLPQDSIQACSQHLGSHSQLTARTHQYSVTGLGCVESCNPTRQEGRLQADKAVQKAKWMQLERYRYEVKLLAACYSPSPCGHTVKIRSCMPELHGYHRQVLKSRGSITLGTDTAAHNTGSRALAGHCADARSRGKGHRFLPIPLSQLALERGVFPALSCMLLKAYLPAFQLIQLKVCWGILAWP